MVGQMPLLQELRSGDENAWSRAFTALWPCAFNGALTPKAALDPDEAEDVAIDSIRKAASKVGDIRRAEDLKPLVVVISQRAAISVARRKSAEKRPQIAASLDDLKEAGIDPAWEHGPTAHDYVAGAELLALFDEALASLPELARSLLVDHVCHGVSHRELSERHGVPMGSVPGMILRALRELRAQLQTRPKLWHELKDLLRL